MAIKIAITARHFLKKICCVALYWVDGLETPAFGPLVSWANPCCRVLTRFVWILSEVRGVQSLCLPGTEVAVVLILAWTPSTWGWSRCFWWWWPCGDVTLRNQARAGGSWSRPKEREENILKSDRCTCLSLFRRRPKHTCCRRRWPRTASPAGRRRWGPCSRRWRCRSASPAQSGHPGRQKGEIFVHLW